MTAIIGSLLLILVLFLGSGVWVGLSLMGTGITMVTIFRDIPIDKLLPQYFFNILTTSELVALPLFVIMGEFLFRTNLSRSLFNGLAPWMGLLPGRLLHVNVVACSIFAAISGSSAATTQVVGRISLTELLRRGYSRDIAIGSLAGAGTLGFLIPPSTVMIIYGVLAEESVLRLFTAGFLPGVLLAVLFMGMIMLRTTINRDLIPESERQLRNASWAVRFAALKELAPVVFLILAVLGSMYGGFATPSEAAAVGVFGAILVAGSQGGLNLQAFRDVALSSMQTCSMIGLIIVGATVLGNITSFLGIAEFLAEYVAELQLTPFMLIVALTAVYLVLGCFLEGFSMIVTTLPVVLPLVTAAGFDKVWFGIFLVIVVELAQITPPVGFNLFVIQGVTGDGIGYITRVTMPFVALMLAFIAFLALFPEFVLWLPNLLFGA
ncbi:TRAP transporter large permease [Cohaesibacter celericrescens]|uniref:TRAP transporter large permease protein n=1 Tax=Cohaesibacter celericrescens TaxID=2067669 RepID=A0A2N5XVS5_9HYPH|nr:TRAP transporter large permease subunit [Cohaesibacter celericrescens]PLW78590.1 C4-dicarboxylate ABC transporter permease [Cohaesibacter celericrescens]